MHLEVVPQCPTCLAPVAHFVVGSKGWKGTKHSRVQLYPRKNGGRWTRNVEKSLPKLPCRQRIAHPAHPAHLPARARNVEKNLTKLHYFHRRIAHPANPAQLPARAASASPPKPKRQPPSPEINGHGKELLVGSPIAFSPTRFRRNMVTISRPRFKPTEMWKEHWLCWRNCWGRRDSIFGSGTLT